MNWTPPTTDSLQPVTTGQVLPGYMYTDTGFWDTFRCLFPLLNLMYPSVNKEMQEGLINTFTKKVVSSPNGQAPDTEVAWLVTIQPPS
jgi:putative alpha-1,2-mannosidase